MLAASGLLDEEDAQEADQGAAADGQAEGEAAAAGGAVDLPRLYEHFLFAMAHKGQYAGGWACWVRALACCSAG